MTLIAVVVFSVLLIISALYYFSPMLWVCSQLLRLAFGRKRAGK